MATRGRATAIHLKMGDATPLRRWKGFMYYSGIGLSVGSGLSFSFGLEVMPYRRLAQHTIASARA
jgi:hypothetical protein